MKQQETNNQMYLPCANCEKTILTIEIIVKDGVGIKYGETKPTQAGKTACDSPNAINGRHVLSPII